jgi:hypothetical protein
VVEIESSTSRKGFLGGYIKAQKYFEEIGEEQGRLLFIINEEKRNVSAVARQLRYYCDWLKGHEILVHPTYLMYQTPLPDCIRNSVSLFSNRFLAAAIKVF